MGVDSFFIEEERIEHMALEFSFSVSTVVTVDTQRTTAFFAEKFWFEINYEETGGTCCSFRQGEAFMLLASTVLEPRSNPDG